MQGVGGYTWPGTELGHAPTFKHSFFEVSFNPLSDAFRPTKIDSASGCIWSCTVLQYVDALRLGDLRKFKEVERESGDWWFPTLDRGSGACLHFAADHGQVNPRLWAGALPGLPAQDPGEDCLYLRYLVFKADKILTDHATPIFRVHVFERTWRLPLSGPG